MKFTTDRPYIWHANDGAELFVLPAGTARILVIDKGERVRGGFVFL